MKLNLMGPKFRFHELFLALGNELIQVVDCLKQAVLGFPDMAGPCTAIHDLSARSEAIRHEIIHELSMVSIRPLDREDVYRLHQSFTLSFNSLKGISSRLALFHIQSMPPSIHEMVDGMVAMARQVRGILEVVNRGERVERLFSVIRETREEFDRFLVVGLAELYETKPSSSSDLLEAMKCAQLYDRFEEAMDRIQHNASSLEAILLKML